MKILLTVALSILISVFVMGCTESTSPTEDPNVIIVGELATRYVNIIPSIKEIGKIQVNEVDSIKVVRIRFLISNMKMFSDSSNTTNGKVIKTEPFVYDINESNDLQTIVNTSILSGVYEKLGFQFHRFSTSEASQYTNDQVFRDFATDERYSILIEGITYKEGNPTVFYYKSQATANLSLKLEPSLNLKHNTITTLSIQIDPNYFFKKWEAILDPNDPKNANDIDNTLINTIKSVKK